STGHRKSEINGAAKKTIQDTASGSYQYSFYKASNTFLVAVRRFSPRPSASHPALPGLLAHGAVDIKP
ncbi:MAG: hypothetical protein WBV91_17110, partial [Desulfobacterales bacterium]